METREVFFNISYPWIMYILAGVSTLLFIFGFYKKLKLIKVGDEEDRSGDFGKRLSILIKHGLFQKRVWEEAYPGFIHASIFFGFLVLFLGTVIVFLQEDLLHPLFSIRFFKGWFYIVSSFILDIAGFFVLLGVIIAFFRRYVQTPERLDNQADDLFSLVFIFFVILSGFTLEGLRIAATQKEFFSPFGNFLASIFLPLGKVTILKAHAINWWIHVILSLAFIVYIPYSKLSHIFFGALNQYFSSLEPFGRLKTLDLEDEEKETFGISKIYEFSWKQLLDLFACTRCGRCQDVCPAYNTKKPLSPKVLTQDLKQNLLSNERLLFEGKKEDVSSLLENGIDEEIFWSCTTCGACQRVCPVFVEHIQKIVDVRRYLVLMESRFPHEVQQTFRNWENNSNPWGIGWSARADWAKDLDIKDISTSSDEIDILYYVGCAGSFDDRNQKVAKAFCKILKKAGVNFGILGTAEKCCGETARRLGNEYLFQNMVMENIETFKEYNIKKIVTLCPHCFNTLKNEYPKFGAEFEVIHGLQFLLDLIEEGKITLKTSKDLSGTYHDSCYLGRYNNIYDEPREILKKIGVSLSEMPRNRERSFCCGAGGGGMWMEEKGERINEERTKEALSLNPKAIFTACPYCLIMISDALKAMEKEEEVKAMDVVEALEKCIE